MPKTKISEFDVDPANNTDINSINIAEGCAPSGINNAIRQLMSDLKEFQTGAAGDSFTVGGAFAANGGATLGDASGDALTINSSAVSIPNGLNFDSNTLVIDATNNRVGVGTGAPAALLETNVASGNNEFRQSVGGTSRGQFISSATDQIIVNGGTGSQQFWTGGSERMRIDSSGNVGIGTSSPNLNSSTGTVCHINNAASGGWAINHYTNGTTSSGASDGFIVGIIGGDGAYLFNYESTPLIFGAGSAERMRIDSSGNLLVGTTSNPWSTKIIGISNGAGSFSFQPANTTTNFRVWGATTSSVYFDNSGSSSYTFSNGSGGSFAPITASAFNIGSDYRLKENITPLTDALSQVNKFKPVKFSYKENNKISMPWGTQIVDGFLAHEFAEVVPTAVTGEKDAVDENGEIVIQTLDMTKAVPLLVAAIQEQQEIINDLKARIETLENK